MQKNMGMLDKTVRVVEATIVGALYFTGIIDGALAIILGILSAVLLFTSAISFCPLYRVFGLSTCKDSCEIKGK